VFSVRARILSGSDDQVSWAPAERLARRLVFALAVAVIAITGTIWSEPESTSGIMEGYYAPAQQDSVMNGFLTTDATPTKDDLMLAVMTK
jgi:hypothetical protein